MVLLPSLFYGVLADGKPGCGNLPPALGQAAWSLGSVVAAKALMTLCSQAVALAWRDALSPIAFEELWTRLTEDAPGGGRRALMRRLRAARRRGRPR